jgi:hypothetical protein
MLVLRRGDGEVMDAMNWGAPDESWPNAALSPLWSPGVMSTSSIVARIPTGFDTNSPSDWQSRETPIINLELPNDSEEYTWKWAHHMNLEWQATNPHGPDNKLKIGLYFIKDKDEDGVISSGDTIHHITKNTNNDGHHGWNIPVGYTGYMWIRAIAISPENPLLIAQSTSGRIKLEGILPGHDWSQFNDLFGVIDGGQSLGDFAPDVNGSDFVSPLFPGFVAPFSDDPDEDENEPAGVPNAHDIVDSFFNNLFNKTASDEQEESEAIETKATASSTPEMQTVQDETEEPAAASTTPPVATTTPTTTTGTSTASVSIHTTVNTGDNDTSTSTETTIVDVSTTTSSASVSFQQTITAESNSSSTATDE